MSAIATEAGLVKGAYIFIFPSKEALLLATLAFETGQFDQRLRDRAAAATNGHHRLTIYIAAYQRARDHLGIILSDHGELSARATLMLALLDVLDLQATIDPGAMPDPVVLREAVLQIAQGFDGPHA